MRLSAIGIGLLAMVSAGVALAQERPGIANPQLTALVGGVRRDGGERPLRIAKLDVGVVVRGEIAETTVTARFENPGSESLEGTFRLRLPEGAIVTGYALDVNGAMIDGVLVEQPRAREAYEDRVRVRVDPGLAEVGRDNVFQTRVFPILPGKTGRTIRLRFVTPLGADGRYALPLTSDEPVGELVVDVADQGDARRAANVRLPMAGAARTRLAADAGGGASGHYSARDVRLEGVLALEVVPGARLSLSTHRSGERFFQISGVGAAGSADRAQPATPRRVRVYWDRSRSRLDDNLAGERALLARYLEQTGATAIEVIGFNSSGAVVRGFTDRQAVDHYLAGLDYRGATSFALLPDLAASPADACLMFTDGIATIDARGGFSDHCAVIASASDANRGFLGRLARGGGGMVLTLDPAAVDRQVAMLRSPRASVIDVRDAAGRALPFAVLDGTGPLRIVGQAPESGAVVIRTTISGGPPVTDRFAIDRSDAPRFDGAGALWAVDKVAELATDDSRAEEMKRLARAYSVIAPDLAFIVLEQPADYVQAKIDPPGSYPAEARARYTALKAEADRTAEAEQAGRRDAIVALWDEQRQWWAATHMPPKQRDRAQVSESATARVDAMSPSPAPPPPAPPPPPVSMPAPAVTMPMPVDAEMSDIIVGTESRREPAQVAAGASGGRSRTRIEATPWQPDRPYLAALSASSPAGFAEAFRTQERLHGTLPAFYLDVAGWLWRKNRRAEAIEMLLSALDLPTADNGTIGIVAERLVRYGEVDRAIGLFERLNLLEAHRPQPARSLALALEKRAAMRTDAAARADLSRAVDLLSAIVLAPQDQAFDGIELISLVEANAIVAKLQRMGVRQAALDPALIAAMDVDVRIVLEWNTDNSDMDLWVDEPTGERAIYNNPNTGIGGQLSNDMTQGFGPEQYLLRRAPNGTYVVSANVYASDRLNPNGATVITARLFRDYGRATQSEEVVDVELTPDERGEKLIGRLIVGGRR